MVHYIIGTNGSIIKINIMLGNVWLLVLFVKYSISEYSNVTVDPSQRQLLDFKLRTKKPIGLVTTSAGKPVDLRDTFGINSDLFSNDYHIDSITQLDQERIPERVVHAKGAGALGYFEVTHDVSKYTEADVFNGIGKKTPVLFRFSSSVQNLGGNDLAREPKGLAVKFYTKEGNLDLLCFNIPVYLYTNPLLFPQFVRAFKRNPSTNLLDFTARFDFATLKPEFLHGLLWTLADFGIPNGYRKSDYFPLHTYEINNKHGEVHYIRFNFRSQQGLAYLTNTQAIALGGFNPDYSTKDLYDAIANKSYPSFKLEMDVMSPRDIRHIDYDPFDTTRLWKNGTYFTVPIGRLVLNRNPENFFRDVEQAAFNPANLVPGIPGPPDHMFKARRHSYRDSQNHRLGVNHNKIEINTPRYTKTYNRDGVPPIRDNMNDSPNYYPNSFNGPVPYVDENRSKRRLTIYQSNAVDLEPSWYFYNFVLKDDAHRQRLAMTTAVALVTVTPPVFDRALNMLGLVDPEYERRVREALPIARAQVAAINAVALSPEIPQ